MIRGYTRLQPAKWATAKSSVTHAVRYRTLRAPYSLVIGEPEAERMTAAKA